MSFGSQPNDAGALVLERDEMHQLVARNPVVKDFVKKYVGSNEFINGLERYAIWVSSEKVSEAKAITELSARFAKVAAHRSSSPRRETNALAATPWQFGFISYEAGRAIIVPRVSSERRKYIPMGYLPDGTIISDAAFTVYGAEPWVFGLLTSRMHMAWTRAVGGKMETRYRYSNSLVYNTFPVPRLSDEQKTLLSTAAFRVLDSREYFSEKVLAELYDPSTMPEALLAAHAELDLLVDSFYRKRAFVGDEDRLSQLFDMYQKISATNDEIKNQLDFDYE
jgi:hypothetical protein